MAGKFAAMMASLPIGGWLAYSTFQPFFDPRLRSVTSSIQSDYKIFQYLPHMKIEITVPAEHYGQAVEKAAQQLDQYVIGANTRLQQVTTIKPIFIQKLTPEEASKEDIFYTMPDRLSKEPVPDMYRVSYVLADKYARTTIGKPNNPYIKLREVHSEIVAARRFWGFPTRNNIQKHQKVLEEALTRDNLAWKSFRVADYNDDYIFYFFRHNEVVAQLAVDQAPDRHAYGTGRQ